MITDWIDKLASVWEIDDGQGKLVKSYHVFDKQEFPDAITEFPAAISYPIGLQPKYSAGGVNVLLWEGVTQFHLVGSVDMSTIAYAMPFFDRILRAAAGSIQLGGLVDWFAIPEEPGAISLVEFEFASGPSHRGILVRWQVKEKPTNLTVTS